MAAPSPALPAAALRPWAGSGGGHWDDCRNALAIARLLSKEGRPPALVATACRMAVDSACRAALEPTGFPWDGDPAAALRRLSVPDEVLAGDAGEPALRGTERIVEWIAAYLRSTVPGRSWSC